MRLGQRRDRCGRQPLDRDTPDRPARDELTEQVAEWMSRLELVVAISDDGKGRNGLDLPSEQFEDVERGLVGPVDVLEDENRRRLRPQLEQQRGRHVVAAGGGSHGGFEPTARLVRDLE
jgi:hypothetical protein